MSEFTQIVANGFKNVQTILKKNFDNEEKRISQQGGSYPLLSCESFKLLIEITTYVIYFLSQIKTYSETFGPSLIDPLRSLLKRTYSPPSKDDSGEKLYIYEDYLQILAKGLYMLYLFKSPTRKMTDIIQIRDYIEVVKLVISNARIKDTRKEIFQQFKVFKEFSELFNERFFFLNDSNYIREDIAYSDSNINEIVRFIINFEDLFFEKIINEEKCELVKRSISRINNFRLTYDLKAKIFVSIEKRLEILINNGLLQHNQRAIFEIVNYLIEQFGFFYESIKRALFEMDNFFIKEERKNKNEHLVKNMLDINFNPPDPKKLQWTNMCQLFEILLSNEYEKYSIVEDFKSLYEILNTTISILKHVSKVFNYEIPQSQNIVPLQMNQYSNPQANSRNDMMSIANPDMYTKVHRKKTKHLSKLFYNFLILYEKFFKSHKHQKDEESSKNFDILLIDAFFTFPSVLCINVFRESMPKIYNLITFNFKICPVCSMFILIDKIFKTSSSDNAVNQVKKDLFEIYFDFFTGKIYEVGNSNEDFEQYSSTNLSMTIIINIIKQLFKYVPLYSSNDYVKNKITSLLINCIILSKSSDFFGNYIYIIRCLFKNLIGHQGEKKEYEFHKEALHLVYGIMKYMINLKNSFPFLKEMITEIILIIPLKFKYLIDFTHLFIPSLIDSLSMNNDIIQIGLQLLEQWMNALFHKPEVVEPFLQKNILQLTTLLTSHLYKNVNISLNSLKLLSKFGGKSRNYIEDKAINFKSCPIQILVISLESKRSGKKLDFPVDNIIDICVKLVTKKISVSAGKKSMAIFRACALTFFDKEINYDYIMKVKEDIVKNCYNNEKVFESNGYFKHFHNNEQIKINNIFRKSENFLFEKILRGVFLCIAMTEAEQESKDFIQFICDYFVMAMIAKDKNNKYIHTFEIDPLIIFDIINEFFFSSNPTVLRNTNQSSTTIFARKLISMIIDTIEKIFDKDYKVIAKLEIIDIMYRKFLNFCYSNDWPKKGIGLILIDMAITRFSKEITAKYLKEIFRVIFSIASSYSSIIEIKSRNECKNVLQLILSKFMIEDDNFVKLSPETVTGDMEIDDKGLLESKENFIMMFEMLQIAVKEIIQSMNSHSQYEISICSYLTQKILENRVFKKNAGIIFMINHLSLEEFTTMYTSFFKENTEELSLALLERMKIEEERRTDISQYKSLREIKNLSEKSLLHKKLLSMLKALTIRLKITESNFGPLISNAAGMIFCFENIPEFIIDYLFERDEYVELLLKMTKSLYETLLMDVFLFLKVSKYIKKYFFLLRYKSIFMEKLYIEKKVKFPFSKDGPEVSEDIKGDDIEKVENFIYECKNDMGTDGNDFNQNDPYAPEFFPILSKKMKMVISYIKLLKLIFSNKTVEERFKGTLLRTYEKFFELKKKTVKLMVHYVIIREENQILKSCKYFLEGIVEPDERIKDFLAKDEDLKIYIRKSIENFKQERELIFGKVVDSLAILLKTCYFGSDAFEYLRKKLEIFRQPAEQQPNQNNDNNFLSFYSFISLFACLKDPNVSVIANDLFELLMLKEREASSSKTFISFTSTKYKNKILKLIFILKKEFTLYLLWKTREFYSNPFLNQLYKKIIEDNKSYLIRETVAKGLTKAIEEEIAFEDQFKRASIMRKLLKLFKIVCKKGPVYMKWNNIMEKLNIYFNDLVRKYPGFSDKEVKQNIDKIQKYIIELSMLYLTKFNNNNHFVFYLFHYYSKSKNQTIKNKILQFVTIDLFSIKKINKYKKLMKDFISHFEHIFDLGCFDSVVKYLIIPMTIKHFKETTSLSVYSQKSATFNTNSLPRFLSIFQTQRVDKGKKPEIGEKVDKVFFIQFLKSLTDKLSAKKIIDAKRNIEKWKLFSLIITIFSEYFEAKPDQIIDRPDEMNVIFNHIKQIAKIHYLRDKQSTTKLFWLLNACLITMLLENKNSEKYVEAFTSCFKDINDEDLSISNLTYQLIFPLSVDGVAFNTTLNGLAKDRMYINQLFQLFSLMLKFPNIIQFQTNYVIQTTLYFLFKYTSSQYSTQYLQLPINIKKLFNQLLGLVIKHFSEQHKKADSFTQQEKEDLKKNETNLWRIVFKIFRILISYDTYEVENMELIKTILTYLREFLTVFHPELPQIEIKSERNKRIYLHCYIYLLKIFMFTGNKSVIYEKPDFYFALLKIFFDSYASVKIFSDLGLVMRLVLDEEAMNFCNKSESVSEDKMIEWRNQIFIFVKKSIDVFNSKKRTKFFDINFEAEQEFSQICQWVTDNFRQNKVIPQDKLTTIFPILDFKFFILYKRFIDRVYNKSDRPPKTFEKTFKKFSKNSFDLTLTTLGLKFGSHEQQVRDSYEVLYKIMTPLTAYYLESFFSFALVFFEIFTLKKENENRRQNDLEQKIRPGYLKECADYFSNNRSFYTSLKDPKDLLSLKNESIEVFSNDPLTQNMQNLENNYLVIPEVIFCGLNFFLNLRELSFQQLKLVNSLLVKTYCTLRDKQYNSVLEHLIVNAINSPIQTIKTSSKLLFDILNSHDFIVDKINPTLMMITCDYLEKYLSKPENSKQDKYANYILRILVCSSHISELSLRKRIFKIFKRFHGEHLIDTLKWIFTYNEWEGQFCDSCTLWISFSVDMILSHFKGSTKLQTEDKCLSKLYNLCFNDVSNEMFVENDDAAKPNELDKDGKIKEMITLYNSIINNHYTKNLMKPVRDVILTDQTLSLKILYSLLPQIWKTLTKDEREQLTMHINNFLEGLIRKGKGINIVKTLMESFSNFYPLIRISPEIVFTLAKTQNSWTSSFFYLENLFIANIDKERTYHCLVRILDILQENKHAAGLKQYMTQNKLSIAIASNLQCGKYLKAEEVLCQAFKSYKEIFDKTDLHFDDLNSFPDNFANEFSYKVDFSIWQSGLIECYKNTNKWSQIVSLTETFNDTNIQVDSMWHSGRQRWKDLELKNLNKTQYSAQINQIYMMMNTNPNNEENNRYQHKCMNCIKTIYQDFITFPPNFEKLDYYYFLVFQLIVEAWESTNTLREAEKNFSEKKNSDFRENLAMWRDRLPHVCEGFQALKSILEPRNYLFDFLKTLIGKNFHNPDEANNLYLNISDKAWNNLMFIKYARKLGLYEVFNDYVYQFNDEFGKRGNMFTYVNFKKNMEILKFLRQVACNYKMGIELSEKFYREIDESSKSSEIPGLKNYIQASFLSQKAYFLYKEGDINQSNDLFKKASLLNTTDYHTYYDWAEMSENVAIAMKGEPKYENIWVENTLVNYLMSIIFKLDKAKYIIPKILNLIKQFEEHNFRQKYDIYIDNIASWIWIFWLPTLLEDFKHSVSTQRNDFFYTILKNVTKAYPQSIYYLLSIYEGESIHNAEAKKKFGELISIITSTDQLNHIVEKIKIMIKEIGNKPDLSKEELLLSSINMLNIQKEHSIDGVLRKLNVFINVLKKDNYELMTKLAEDLSILTSQRNVTIFSIFEKLKQYRYYLHSKLTTENNYQELKRILTNDLYNTSFEGVEIPGLYSNKIIEPSEENRICIYRFESEYNYKFLTFLNKKILIRGTNDKVFNFSLSKEYYGSSSEPKVSQLQVLLNCVFSRYKDTYEQKVKFNTPIKYFLTNVVKITQEESSQYYLNEVFEFCMQKNGYDSEIAYTIYDQENNPRVATSYYSREIKERVYEKMCQIIPLNSLKSFIHKFIVSGDEIFIFRKQFATSYGLNSFFGSLFNEWITLNKISFNKETGSITFHDMKCVLPEDPKKLFEKKMQIRLSKNISHFLTPACLYGVIPSVMYATVSAIVDKEDIFRKIIGSTFITNISNRPNEVLSFTQVNSYVDYIMKTIHYIRNTNGEDNPEEHPLQVILEIINTSMSDENLKNKPLFWDPWF